MREKKMGMRAVLTRLLGIATVACALVAAPGGGKRGDNGGYPERRDSGQNKKH